MCLIALTLAIMTFEIREKQPPGKRPAECEQPPS